MTTEIISPCTGVCKLDEASGWCLGCGRSGDEIADWRTVPQRRRDDIWNEVPSRLSKLGIICQRLPWTTEQIKQFVLDTLQRDLGTWVMGVVGGVAEFTNYPETKTSVKINRNDLTAKTFNGAMRMTIDDHVRALTFDPPELGEQKRIVLAIKRERGRLPVSMGVTDLGDDTDAMLVEPESRLFDLGLARKEARFSVRVKDENTKNVLTETTGLPFIKALPELAPTLLSSSPTRVVETALGRIEVQGSIPSPGASSPLGPHTHLLPDYLATGRALPVGMDIPRAYLPGAIFYPRGEDASKAT